MGMATQTLSGNPRRIVLVADDEPAIRDIIGRVINHLGMETMLVGDGAAALAFVKQRKEHTVCAILDVQMPIMNGADAAHAIKQFAPELPIVMMSGGIPNSFSHRIRQLSTHMLSKPFSLVALRDVLAQVVGGVDGDTL